MTIQQRFVVVSHPDANGQVAVTNQTISEGIKKRLEGSRGKWVDELDTVLWAYCTISQTATCETFYSLVYESEAVIPAEIIFESPRIKAYDEEANTVAWREDLDSAELKREIAHIRAAKYKSQVKALYTQRVKT